MFNGLCLTCRSDADCAASGNTWGGDGGEVRGQTSCQSGHGGANCQVGGSCQDCAVDYVSSTCGTRDGGEVSGQINCFTASRLCVASCSTNSDCVGTQGLNCMSNGLCLTCRSDADCAASGNTWGGDGGEVRGQTSCQSGLCTTPFSCTSNAMCPGHGGANCQVGGSCQDCAVDYVSSTCGTRDGGEVSGQINCFTTTRLCIGRCSANSDCIGTQGLNCMSNGLCLTCRSNADCSTGNSWLGDGGEIPSQTICGAGGICQSACTGNFGSATSNPCPSTAANCMYDGICRSCTGDSDCNSNDGPPQTSAKNIICSSSGICVDPFSCGTVPATSSDNQGCQANYPGQAKNNCWADGSCRSCTSNTDCYSNDGGRVPKQPRCDVASGTCVGCTSNADCPSQAANCNRDGFCYDCRTFAAGSTCPLLDGPPGAVAQPNCDPVTGTCVNFCTQDSHCTDTCYPHCQIERGCCVECNTDRDCPLLQWRGAEKNKMKCDTNAGYVCVGSMTPSAPTPAVGVICQFDSDCGNTTTPACSVTQNKCVECLFDGHCTGAMKACHVGAQHCVECVSSGYCQPGYYCGSDLSCHEEPATSSAFHLVLSVAFLVPAWIMF
eukprot:TRINITY_DN290_c0_g2_i10.p2 TRINITY_DN290_c0_g2~~TRINITY_DN290_c0_g2_i10.p2  ORF type:complete len:607 (+),score=124.87 TRINITY_DN290_c0_g2_i10:2027-3847(+)